MAIFWAVISLIFSACIDITFKLYAGKSRSSGVLISGCGLVWIGMAVFSLNHVPSSWSGTLFWGLLSGFFSAGGNLLMLGAMRTLDVGVCSTVYRLNMVPALLGAVLFLGEEMSGRDMLGVVFALLAVAGFVPWQNRGSGRKLVLPALGVMVLASLMRASMGLSYRYGFTHGADRDWVVFLNGIFWFAGGWGYYWVYERRRRQLVREQPRPGRKSQGLYVLLAGVFVGGNVFAMALSLQLGNASVVLPIAQMSFVLTGLIGVLFFKEKVGFCKGIAMLCGIAAVLILSLA